MKKIDLPDFLVNEIDELAYTFNMPVSYVRNGIEVCLQVGITTEYFVDRYLRKLPVNESQAFTNAYKGCLSTQHTVK